MDRDTKQEEGMIWYIHTSSCVYVVVNGRCKNILRSDPKGKHTSIPGIMTFLGCSVALECSVAGGPWNEVDFHSAKEDTDSAHEHRLRVNVGAPTFYSDMVTELQFAESEDVPPSLPPEVQDRESVLPVPTVPEDAPRAERPSSPDQMLALIQAGWDDSDPEAAPPSELADGDSSGSHSPASV